MGRNLKINRDFVLFAVGAIIGSAATWLYLKDEYDRRLKEDVDSVKESFGRLYKKEEKPEEEEEIRMTEEKIETLEDREEVEKEEDTKTVSTVEENSEEVNREEDNTVKSIFEGLDENERYAVYKVHIVTENDTTESIVSEYGVTRDDLEAYNDLSDLKIGDKLIIPSHED